MATRLPLILLVDDDPIGIRTRTAVLERNGYSVLTASTADQGLRVLRNKDVDLVMSDHFLRDKRGTALAEEMKRIKPDVPVMIFSGAAEVPDDVGKADVFVTKLEAIPVMLREIERLLHLHKA
jgi:DNA-binding NtrC family response regulator